ncbi:MAG TPA: lysophospholipid acyltransferase family protein [Pyrinomonadaceae bacterium]|nr:lysophospholipid acyltransferase family protein [Pyrinomonadaceae bacterium]
MRTLRAATRLAALCAMTAALCAVWAGAGLACVSSRARTRRRGLVFRAWARAAAVLLGMRLGVSGAAPRPPFLLVVNHLGYVDVLALAASCECVFVAKEEVASWPVVGRLCRRAGTIFVNRRSPRDIPRALGEVEAALDEGAGVVLFAEGTSTRGAGVLPFKSPLLEAAARRRLPVHYASLSYRTPAGEACAETSVCWWGDMTFPGHFFDLLKLRSFRARLDFGEGPISDYDRKALAVRLRAAVSANFVPVG